MKIFISMIAALVLNCSYALAKPTGGYMLCRSKQIACDYACPKGVSRFDRMGCVPLRGTSCPATGILTQFLPMNDVKNGYIATFAEETSFPDLLCQDVNPSRRKNPSARNPVKDEYDQLFGR